MKKSYLKYISALFIFGSNGIVASYIHLNSYEIVFLRTLIASIFLLCVFLLSKRKLEVLENKKDFLYLVALPGGSVHPDDILFFSLVCSDSLTWITAKYFQPIRKSFGY